MTLVLGLDLSFTGTGRCHIDGVLDTLAAPAFWPLDRRLDFIAESVTTLARRADLTVIEDMAPVRTNATAMLGKMHGAVRLDFHRAGVKYVLVPPATAKKYATGKGNATKPDMRVALLQRARLDIRDDNQVDAWWLRAIGLELVGEPLVVMPAINREGLSKLELPAGLVLT